MMRIRRIVLSLAIGAVAVVAVAGCGGPAGPPGPTASVSVTSPQPVDGVVHVSESANGSTVTVGVGDEIVATLHNTYWRFETPGGVLEQQGEVVVTPDPRGSCLPGVGCGTVRLTARAVRGGEGELVAGRTTCGEAMGCPSGQGSWSVHVQVR